MSDRTVSTQEYPGRSEGAGSVSAVERGDAYRAGLRAGDVVVSVDGAPVRDVIDWLWLTDGPVFDVCVEREGRPLVLTVRRSSAGPLGVSFDSPLFDAIRECDNACAFCFISQLPPGLRPSLYVRDDDYRLSFLSGNFVTLTNLTDDDVARITVQHLSPLHVSVHAVDPDVRGRLICPTVEDRALELLDTLLDTGIEVHVQIVLVPGVNDGDVLDETLGYLAERPGVVSVGCVPMGFTGHQRRFSASFDRSLACSSLTRIHAWQQRMRAGRGIGWVYAADELYLLADDALPGVDDYDDFPQYENGVGMVSAFKAEFAEVAGARADTGADTSARQPVTAVSGTLFAPVLREVLDAAGFGSVRVLPVRNSLFGGNVSVTGLLGGRDIAAAVARDGSAGTYLIPEVVVNSDGLLLDDVPASSLGGLSGGDVRLIGSDGAALARALTTPTGRTRT
ncbi:MAG: DUF512 domain-containing protein [Coriobacteriia bacterium]|nr:DUF512 domain-containing protein [Coriobacteriia bacterium]